MMDFMDNPRRALKLRRRRSDGKTSQRRVEALADGLYAAQQHTLRKYFRQQPLQGLHEVHRVGYL